MTNKTFKFSESYNKPIKSFNISFNIDRGTIFIYSDAVDMCALKVGDSVTFTISGNDVFFHMAESDGFRLQKVSKSKALKFTSMDICLFLIKPNEKRSVYSLTKSGDKFLCKYQPNY